MRGAILKYSVLFSPRRARCPSRSAAVSLIFGTSAEDLFPSCILSDCPRLALRVLFFVSWNSTRRLQVYDNLNFMMDDYKLPGELRIKIRDYFRECRHMNRAKTYTTLNAMMSYELRGEVAVHTSAATAGFL